ncbi:MAG: C4-dicarboxylate ABC transporter permease [Halobacteriovoraceae bacterium]|nr:C4-dicarboxylate ABC transporter permease [Halobacteriovoraceae bacterium]|tara:strand:- start:3989 stop:4435 length:447 start_codon:yes stop_codon:yes gene_type:complete
MLSLKKILETFLVFIFGALVFCVLWQVFSRYILNSPSTVTEELARFLLIWLTMFGASYTFMEKGHLALELLAEKLNHPQWLEKVIAFALVFFGLIFILGGSHLVHSIWSLGQTTAVLGIPMAIIYLAAPLNGLIVFVFGCQQALEGHK